MPNPTLKLRATLATVFCLAIQGNAVAADPPPEATPELTSAQVKLLIAGFEAQPTSPTAQRVSKYMFNGEPLWLIGSPCCDQFDYLYNAEGHPVCAPSGGIAGRGDGQCPEGIEPFAPQHSPSKR